MPSTHLNLREDDVVRLALEFLHNRDLHITQLSLERETGVINGNFADDVLFLRQLILDGQWDDVLEFIQPLGALRTFEADKFNYAILRHKYIELLCIKSEIKANNNVENIVEEIVKVLNHLERLAPSKEEYSNLCLLLTLPSITDHAQFKKWNPSNARVQCFQEVYPLVEQFLPCDKKSSVHAESKASKNDRLMQLVIKGLLYESCVNYCQAKATGSNETQSSEVNFSRLLDGSGFNESDLSLLSWLQSIPAETFNVPFEQRTLNVDVERLERPSLHTSWTEHMLVTPIKPRTFPHLAMPFRRPRSAADAMTRSLRPLPDGAPRHPTVMALSAMDYGPSTSCYAGFHLTGIKSSRQMNTSVDRLFEKNGENDVIALDDTSENNTALGRNGNTVSTSNVTTPEHRAQDSSASLSASISATVVATEHSATVDRSAATDRGPAVAHAAVLHRPSTVDRSLATEPPSKTDRSVQPQPPPQPQVETRNDADFRPELIKEYQLQKQKECDDYIRQLSSSDKRQGDANESRINESGDSVVMLSDNSVEPDSPGPTAAAGRLTNENNAQERRDSLGIPASPSRDLEHPSMFPSTLRRDNLTTSTVSLRRDTPSPTPRLSSNRHSMGSYPNLSRNTHQRRDSLSTNTVRDMKRDYVGSTNSLSRKSPTGNMKSSVDSLDSWRNSWDADRRGSVTSDLEEAMQEERLTYKYKPQNRHDRRRSIGGISPAGGRDGSRPGTRPTFKPVTVLEDLLAVRCTEFHPDGSVYAVGSNTKTLRICSYPNVENIKDDHEPTPPSVLLKRTKHHRGSIYCLAWSPIGDLLASGSNDKTVKLMRYNSRTSNLEGEEVELAIHDGTVRDVCFIEDTFNKTSLLVSGGAGDCKIYVTDCATGKPFQALSGHSGHVLSLYNWGGAMFVSGGQDKSVRFWDLRTGGCVKIISPPISQKYKGSSVASVAVDPSGRLLVCGHEDGSCWMHDVRGSRDLQRFTVHSSDVRSVRFSPGAYYLLTAGYDGRVVLTDLQGDLTCPLPSVVVARHPDKAICARWHPDDFSFVSTSADKTAVLWTIPPA